MPAIPPSSSPGHKALSERANIALGRLQEERDVEFKRSATWQVLQFGIIKTALAMANLPGGGVIVVGVAQDDHAWRATGVSASDLATFDPDDVFDRINSFASPSIRLTLVTHAVPGCSDMLLLEVHPFESSPVVCKKNGPDGEGLRVGAVYIRPAGGKAESRPIRSAEEMHDMLERAAELRSRRFLEAANRLGMRAADQDAERFRKERGNL